MRQRLHQAGVGNAGEPPKGGPPGTPPPVTEGPGPSQVGGALFKQKNGEGPLGVHARAGAGRLGLRGVMALTKDRLVTIHPNPGPVGRRGTRGRGEARREGRRIRRHGNSDMECAGSVD